MISTKYMNNRFKKGSNLKNIFKRTQKYVSDQILLGYQYKFTI